MSTRRNYESDDAYRFRKLLEHNEMLLLAHEMRRQEARRGQPKNGSEDARSGGGIKIGAK